MNEDIRIRFKTIYKNECGTIDKFADILCVKYGTLKNVISRGENPNFEILRSIALNYPKYSINWLITGRGEMLLNGDKLELHHEKTEAIKPNKQANKIPETEYLFKRLEELSRENERLKIEIEQMKSNPDKGLGIDDHFFVKKEVKEVSDEK
ncbi:MAG: hypothetical protein BGN96_06785 [Bacteroidales bacterium 45-6]|uniref:hypothetical protein n=1 Tax=uncultured Dysgonomonas sp. TaxID=206096 RepID=UPI0009683130|nr:hypothetical protein [uncultured Dysgonomonas sp.]OJU45946.1 MAG: hypothetical protein BGN96_06785 [Bacteroidales bacterium 45-6]